MVKIMDSYKENTQLFHCDCFCKPLLLKLLMCFLEYRMLSRQWENYVFRQVSSLLFVVWQYKI